MILAQYPQGSARIKWGYALSRVTDLPLIWAQVRETIQLDDAPPRHGDVMVAQVETISQHTRIDLAGGVKSQLFHGDLVGLTFAPRYATSLMRAVVPAEITPLHFVCAGGICAFVEDMKANASDPTELRPLGYLMRDGQRVNLRDFALRPTGIPTDKIDIIIVVGSSMDAGKTTAPTALSTASAAAGSASLRRRSPALPRPKTCS